jgi:hypothetical protein
MLTTVGQRVEGGAINDRKIRAAWKNIREAREVRNQGMEGR